MESAEFQKSQSRQKVIENLTVSPTHSWLCRKMIMTNDLKVLSSDLTEIFLIRFEFLPSP